MTRWEKCSLGDLFEIKHGYAFKGEFFSDEGPFVLLTPGNFREEGGLKLKGDKEKFYTGKFPEEFMLHRGDLLDAMTDLTQNAPILGSPAFIPQDGRFLHNQRLGKIINLKKDEIVPAFLFYLLNTAAVRGQIKGSASGATVRHTSPSRIYEVSVEIPPFLVQQQIAGILSTYDDLIENNARRIKILEEMAKLIYREWFVNFRFPGHEKVRMVDSPIGKIPEGWEVRKLKDICNLTMGQSPKSEFYNENGKGLPFHQGVTNFGERHPTDHLFCSVDGRIAEAGDILFSVRAPVGRMNIANKKIVIGRGLSAIRHKNGFQAFLWEQLSSRFTKVDMMGNGAIFAAVTRDDMQGIDLLCPPEPLVIKLNQRIEPIHDQISCLLKQISNLRRTRDLLLPKLISGELDVSELDIEVPAEAK